jgi:hypothetical protein
MPKGPSLALLAPNGRTRSGRHISDFANRTVHVFADHVLSLSDSSKVAWTVRRWPTEKAWFRHGVHD